MLERTQCKGKNKYDPQIGEAAKANAALAARAQEFSESFTNKYIVPATEQAMRESAAASEREGKLFDLNYSQAQLQDERYRTLGIPAEDRYYDMVDKYSEKSEQTRQADRAIGDVRVAGAQAQQSVTQKLASLGINPASPAAIAAMSNLRVQQGAAEASAGTRAREAAKTLGMSLTADAANFGRGGQSGILNFGGAASGNSSASAGISQSGVGAVAGGAGVNQNAYGLGIKAYGQNLDAYTSLGKQSMQSGGGLMSGLGSLAGTVLGASTTGGGSVAAKLLSDRRLKTNIKVLARLPNGLNLYEFSFKDDPSRKHTGFMADEVEKVNPAAVFTRDDGYKMVDYGMAVS